MQRKFNLIMFLFLALFCIAGTTSTVLAADAPSPPSNLRIIKGTDNCVENPTESFDSADAPQNNAIGGYWFSTPWGYDKPDNATRQYPIVVIGCWNESSFFTEAVKKKYPAFFLTFIHCSYESEGVDLSNAIDAAISYGLRIDTNRIHLTGFSKGGSGGYKIIRGFQSAGKLFAGVVRIAGGSQTALPDDVVEKSSIWYHIGLRDSQGRIQTADDAYAFIKNHEHNTTAVESSETDEVDGYNRTTWTLTKDNIEIMKLSKYEGMGHTPDPPYADPQIFDWLFSQSLNCR